MTTTKISLQLQLPKIIERDPQAQLFPENPTQLQKPMKAPQKLTIQGLVKFDAWYQCVNHNLRHSRTNIQPPKQPKTSEISPKKRFLIHIRSPTSGSSSQRQATQFSSQDFSCKAQENTPRKHMRMASNDLSEFIRAKIPNVLSLRKTHHARKSADLSIFKAPMESPRGSFSKLDTRRSVTEPTDEYRPLISILKASPCDETITKSSKDLKKVTFV